MIKYIIFVPDSLLKFQNNFLCCFKCKLTSSFRDQGIEIIKSSEIEDWKYNNKFNNLDLTFDYEQSPELNKLYIYLCGTLYFSDNNYTRYRLNLEKDLLLLICGYLGAKEIKVDEERHTKKETSINLNIDAVQVESGIENSKTKENNSNNQLKETYPIDVKTLLFEPNRNNFEEELFNKIEEININYKEYYKICSKLKIFACKRFNLRMNTYTYHLEEETKNSKIQKANVLLDNYGIGIKIEGSNTLNYSYNYNIVFYDNDELFFNNKLIDDGEKDIFVKLRKEYLINYKINKLNDPDWKGDATEIFKEVEKYVREKNIYEDLEKWYADHSIDEENNPSNRSRLEGQCHWFKNEIDVIKHLKNILPISFI